jgi:hypothetical protein
MNVLGMNSESIKGGFMTTVAIEVVRGLVNGAIKTVTPKELVTAIRDDTSLWGIASGDINEYTKSLPLSDLSMISDVKKVVDAQYGGFDTVVLKWLQSDHPILYNIIVNTPDGRGRIWLKKQIDDILEGVQNGSK